MVGDLRAGVNIEETYSDSRAIDSCLDLPATTNPSHKTVLLFPCICTWHLFEKRPDLF